MAFYAITMSFYRSHHDYRPPLAGTFGELHFIVKASSEEDAQDKFLHAHPNALREGDLSMSKVSEKKALQLVSDGEARVALGSRLHRDWPWAGKNPRRSRRNSTGFVASKIRAHTRAKSNPRGVR